MELNNTKLKKTTEEMKDILNSIIWIIVITIAAAVSLNLSALAAAMTGGFLPEPVSASILALSILFSFDLVPKLIYKRLLNFERRVEVGWRTAAGFILLFIFLLQFTDYSMTIHFLAIGIGEEYLFRKLHYDYLNEKIGSVYALILTSLIFALLLHINETFLSNLFVRFPIGMVLGMIRIFFNIKGAMVAHWIYNIFATIG